MSGSPYAVLARRGFHTVETAPGEVAICFGDAEIDRVRRKGLRRWVRSRKIEAWPRIDEAWPTEDEPSDSESGLMDSKEML